MIAHRDDLTFGVENSARVVAALFDIGGKCGAAKSGAHFFGDRVIKILEDFEFDRIASHEGGSQCTRGESASLHTQRGQRAPAPHAEPHAEFC